MTEPNAYDDTDLLNYAIQTGIISLDTICRTADIDSWYLQIR